jgi:vancomycin resistance protein YoaR
MAAEPSNQPSVRGKLIALFIAGGIALLMVSCYLGLCFWTAFSGRMLPHSQSMSVEVGGMTYAEAGAALQTAFESSYPDGTLELHQTSTQTSISIPTNLMTISVKNSSENFFVGGASFISSLVSAPNVAPTVTFTSDSDTYLTNTVGDFASKCDQALSQSAATVTDTALTLTKGASGYTVDQTATVTAIKLLLQDAAQAVGSNPVDLSLEAVSSSTTPVSPDFNELYSEIYVAPQNATFDKTTYAVTPSVTGKSFDVAAAQQAYDALGAGESCTIPLVLTNPDVTTKQLEASLFHDILGSVSTTIGGVPNRVSNVKNAAKFCNGVVVLPGETFSYVNTVNPLTESNGYLSAPAYVAGETVLETGGGICQVSSSIYYSALKANLEIVERHNHMYAVGYVPDGMDATVYSTSLDFKFKNNTNYPIKIVTATSGRKLTVTLYGTKINSSYVVMTNKRLSTSDYQVVYVPDETVPVGTTVEAVTPYTGRVVEAYRNVYSGDGTLISSTLESTNTYKKRDQQIHYNPADAASLGLAAISKNISDSQTTGSAGTASGSSGTGTANNSDSSTQAQTSDAAATAP